MTVNDTQQMTASHSQPSVGYSQPSNWMTASHWQPTDQMAANHFQPNLYPSWLSSTYEPTGGEYLYVLNEVEKLKERVKTLEDRLSEPHMTTNDDTGITGLNGEQRLAISMITSNQSIGWQVALRRVLMVVFGEETLAESCCQGRKNATHRPLDKGRLNEVKGIQ